VAGHCLNAERLSRDRKRATNIVQLDGAVLPVPSSTLIEDAHLDSLADLSWNPAILFLLCSWMARRGAQWRGFPSSLGSLCGSGAAFAIGGASIALHVLPRSMARKLRLRSFSTKSPVTVRGGDILKTGEPESMTQLAEPISWISTVRRGHPICRPRSGSSR
jgi:hypothetical protein